MTFKEKLMQDYPSLSPQTIDDVICDKCPSDFGYQSKDIEDLCCVNGIDCTECWDRKIPGTEQTEKENNTMPTKAIPTMNDPTKYQTRKTKAELLAELETARETIGNLEKEVENLERYKQYEETANEMAAMRDAFVNSGFTREEAFQMLTLMVEHAAKLAKPRSIFDVI